MLDECIWEMLFYQTQKQIHISNILLKPCLHLLQFP